MKTKTRLLAMSAVIVCMALAGCTPRYVITQELTADLRETGLVRIGEVEDLLPADTPADKRPSAEDIAKFQNYLRDEIKNRKHLGLTVHDGANAEYEIQSRLLDYTKGSGFARFMFGFGAGAAKVLTEVKLVDLIDGSVIFSGNFEGVVTDGLESGDTMFKNVARDFSKELEKQTGTKPAAADEPIL